MEFDKDVVQDSFRSVDFDLNVESESAQVVYNGDKVQATAANATITGANTTDAEYNVTDTVKWAADGTNVAPTDEDPNPKADAEVSP